MIDEKMCPKTKSTQSAFMNRLCPAWKAQLDNNNSDFTKKCKKGKFVDDETSCASFNANKIILADRSKFRQIESDALDVKKKIEKEKKKNSELDKKIKKDKKKYQDLKETEVNMTAKGLTNTAEERARDKARKEYESCTGSGRAPDYVISGCKAKYGFFSNYAPLSEAFSSLK